MAGETLLPRRTNPPQAPRKTSPLGTASRGAKLPNLGLYPRQKYLPWGVVGVGWGRSQYPTESFLSGRGRHGLGLGWEWLNIAGEWVHDWNLNAQVLYLLTRLSSIYSPPSNSSSPPRLHHCSTSEPARRSTRNYPSQTKKPGGKKKNITPLTLFAIITIHQPHEASSTRTSQPQPSRNSIQCPSPLDQLLPRPTSYSTFPLHTSHSTSCLIRRSKVDLPSRDMCVSEGSGCPNFLFPSDESTSNLIVYHPESRPIPLKHVKPPTPRK
ncbi:hypothetical protein BGZ61DRAFT_475403 [Ilyonectria robusta]|uniref:uncharacterized protein n=1 Tax=Ilyonectria robusta TaxID=1079257 RepID=UPI001E8CAECA|nr:uncharacterized protein BGZ61DRAFT_475403 [Ilyonectria robusta]KAH8729840.1 hypothetical protein BGZ61DRAFT_475403 [Ilyonectria robusta]